MEQRIHAPDAREFQRGMVAFVLTVGAIAYVRAREFGPRRMGYVARQLALEFQERFTEEHAQAVVADFEDAPTALGALFEELVYIACKYREHASNAGLDIVVVGNQDDFATESGNAFSQDVIEEIDIVKGSIAKLLEKLPRWAQRIIEALMEALKLTRGG
jgi:hypothetical protein